MAFNESKFIHLSFFDNSRIIPTSYTIDHTSINTKDWHRDLGVILPSTLKWNEECNNMSLKAYRILGLLCRHFKHSTSVTAKWFLYISLIRFKLTFLLFGILANLIKDIVCLESIQRRTTKFILHDFEYDHTRHA